MPQKCPKDGPKVPKIVAIFYFFLPYLPVFLKALKMLIYWRIVSLMAVLVLLY